MIPYRFTFLFSFVLIWMAYRAWLLRDSVQSWQLVCAVGLSICVALLHEDFSSEIFLIFNIVMLVLTLGLFTFIYIRRQQMEKLKESLTNKEIRRQEKQYQSWVSCLTALVIGAEIILNLCSF
jgi:preprotein translocase subunit YajC